MKKYFTIASILLLAAGCAKTQPVTVINYPPAQNQQATSTPDQNAGWQTYRSIQYSFEFQYPPDFGFNQATNTFLPDYLVQLEPLQNKHPGTNYAGSSFAVSTGFTKTAHECLASQQDKKPLTESKIINGVTFYRDEFTGAAAGNIYDSTLYRTWNNTLCLEAALTIHTSNIANFQPGTVTEVDQSKPMAVLLQILDTFKFTK